MGCGRLDIISFNRIHFLGDFYQWESGKENESENVILKRKSTI